MNIKELGAQLAASHPNIPARAIDKILRAALEALRHELETSTESSVKAAPLGVFKLHERAAKEGEAADADGKRRISLRLAKAKVGQEAKPGKAGKVGKAAKTGKADKPALSPEEKAARKQARQASKQKKASET